MNVIQFRQQKELEIAFSELPVFRENTAVTFHETNTAGTEAVLPFGR
jgi:hypothetical protein